MRGPRDGARRSKVRMKRSTPAAARMVGRYLFQSWVSASEGGLDARANAAGGSVSGWL